MCLCHFESCTVAIYIGANYTNTRANYLAGEYVFGTMSYHRGANSHGLAAFANTKAGGLLSADTFFSRFNEGSMLGTAWLYW